MTGYAKCFNDNKRCHLELLTIIYLKNILYRNIEKNKQPIEY